MHLFQRVSADCAGSCLPSTLVKGCLHPPPLSGQCSYSYENATRLCNMWDECFALNCNLLRNDCQARGKQYKLSPSFGDANTYIKSSELKNIETTKKLELFRDLKYEQKLYNKHFSSHYFLHDAVYIRKTFFKNKRSGFFIESGAFDGSVFGGSNSYYFEKYLEWKGLLIEASMANFHKLVRRRNETPGVQKICTALCSFNGLTKFSSETGGCCGKTNQGHVTVQCTKTQNILQTYNVSRVDFWSLDVEGGEMDVLIGLNWTIPIYVLLIESVTPPIRKILKKNGFHLHRFRSPSRLNEIWVNEDAKP